MSEYFSKKIDDEELRLSLNEDIENDLLLWNKKLSNIEFEFNEDYKVSNIGVTIFFSSMADIKDRSCHNEINFGIYWRSSRKDGITLDDFTDQVMDDFHYVYVYVRYQQFREKPGNNEVYISKSWSGNLIDFLRDNDWSNYFYPRLTEIINKMKVAIIGCADIIPKNPLEPFFKEKK